MSDDTFEIPALPTRAELRAEARELARLRTLVRQQAREARHRRRAAVRATMLALKREGAPYRLAASLLAQAEAKAKEHHGPRSARTKRRRGQARAGGGTHAATPHVNRQRELMELGQRPRARDGYARRQAGRARPTPRTF